MDYQATARWLLDAPAGEARDIATRAYARTLASHDPKMAGEWAHQLPPGPPREIALREISGGSGDQ